MMIDYVWSSLYSTLSHPFPSRMCRVNEPLDQVYKNFTQRKGMEVCFVCMYVHNYSTELSDFYVGMYSANLPDPGLFV